MERLWAYLTAQDLLQEADTVTEDQLNAMRQLGCEEPGKYAKQLALQVSNYNVVMHNLFKKTY